MEFICGQTVFGNGNPKKFQGPNIITQNLSTLVYLYEQNTQEIYGDFILCDCLNIQCIIDTTCAFIAVGNNYFIIGNCTSINFYEGINLCQLQIKEIYNTIPIFFILYSNRSIDLVQKIYSNFLVQKFCFIKVEDIKFFAYLYKNIHDVISRSS